MVVEEQSIMNLTGDVSNYFTIEAIAGLVLVGILGYLAITIYKWASIRFKREAGFEDEKARDNAYYCKNKTAFKVGLLRQAAKKEGFELDVEFELIPEIENKDGLASKLKKQVYDDINEA